MHKTARKDRARAAKKKGGFEVKQNKTFEAQL
jgi:hypothetical protein